MNIAVKCKRFNEVQNSLTEAMASQTCGVRDAYAKAALVGELRNDILALVNDHMNSVDLETGACHETFATDLAYFNTWLNLRGGWKL